MENIFYYKLGMLNSTLDVKYAKLYKKNKFKPK